MKLIFSGGEEIHKTARFKNWDAAKNSARFAVFNSGRMLVDAQWGGADCTQYTVCFDHDVPAVRTVPRADVIPTVRLYLDAQRLRHNLDTMPMMSIRPVR